MKEGKKRGKEKRTKIDGMKVSQNNLHSKMNDKLKIQRKEKDCSRNIDIFVKKIN